MKRLRCENRDTGPRKFNNLNTKRFCQVYMWQLKITSFTYYVAKIVLQKDQVRLKSKALLVL